MSEIDIIYNILSQRGIYIGTKKLSQDPILPSVIFHNVDLSSFTYNSKYLYFGSWTITKREAGLNTGIRLGAGSYNVSFSPRLFENKHNYGTYPNVLWNDMPDEPNEMIYFIGNRYLLDYDKQNTQKVKITYGTGTSYNFEVGMIASPYPVELHELGLVTSKSLDDGAGTNGGIPFSGTFIDDTISDLFLYSDTPLRSVRFSDQPIGSIDFYVPLEITSIILTNGGMDQFVIDGLENLTTLNLYKNVLSQESMRIITDRLVQYGKYNGILNISTADGDNYPDTSTIDNIDVLTSKGWTVTYDTH